MASLDYFPRAYSDLYLIDSTPYEGDSQEQVWECDMCGSIVRNRERHIAYHEAQR